LKLYLSSYKLGDKVEELKRLISATNKEAAYLPNALDFSDDPNRRRKGELSDIKELEGLGLRVQLFDLREFFQRRALLERRMNEFGVFWARGGNAFVLRQAMKLSGFDEVLRGLVLRDDLLYGGYSAGACVLSPSLKGIDLMDNPAAKPYGNRSQVIWTGLGLVDYAIVPHYRSDHPESHLAEKAIEYLRANKVRFRKLKDGEVIVAKARRQPELL